MQTVVCSCRARANNEAMLRSLGLLKQTGEYTFDSFTTGKEWQCKAKALALEYVESGFPQCWFFIGGQSGAGKTHLCTAIISAISANGHALQYTRWVDDGRRIKAVESGERDTQMKKYKGTKVLYIDDLFKTNPTEADRGLAFELLNSAYASGQAVIISSERTIAEINSFDAAIAGRIRERAGKYCIGLSGTDKNFRMYGSKETGG